ncbi:tumor protein p53-inducible protein 13 isoform 2-T2 [Thomomys bottae]
MVPPPPSAHLLLLAALAGFLGPREVVVCEPAEEAGGARCPEGLWPLPPQAEGVAFFYHPCAHPWLKLQLVLLAHIFVPKPTLILDSNLSRDRPVVLTAWGMALEMAWVEPAWAAHWLKRRQWRKQRKKAPALAFALRSWRPPGAEVASRGPRRSSSSAKKRGLRAVLEVQPTSSGRRGPSTSPSSLKALQPILGTLGQGDNVSPVPSVPELPGGLGGNASSRTGAHIPQGQGSSQGCACPSQASMAPRAAAPPPPRVARGPTPRTEEAAWAAMALTFLLVLLTLATLCTRLHRNFRRSESIYWGPTADSRDTVAAVLKRRLLMAPRRLKRSRRRPLLPSAPDSGPDGESSD